MTLNMEEERTAMEDKGGEETEKEENANTISNPEQSLMGVENGPDEILESGHSVRPGGHRVPGGNTAPPPATV